MLEALAVSLYGWCLMPLTLVPDSRQGNRHAAKSARWDTPPWRRWKASSRAARAISWVETYARVPSGQGYGKALRLHPFQKDIVEALIGGDTRVSGLQICRGNAKSTLIAALGLWALCDEPDAPQVPLVAANSLHAKRTLFHPIRRMIQSSPELVERLIVYTAAGQERIASPWNEGELLPLPADHDRLQGLNPSIAIIDEAQTVDDEILWALRQGAGKRANSTVVAVGTPGADLDCSLYRLRGLANASGREAWHEYSAPEDADPLDQSCWESANPALAVGLLDRRVLEDEAEAVRLEHPGARALFRMYRLGHWISGASGWLPPGSWEMCPQVDMAPAGTDVVLALDGTYQRSMALVASTLDGGIFLVWAAEQASDEEVTDVLQRAFSQWNVVELAHFARIRPGIVDVAREAGVATYPWLGKVAEEVTSANEMYRAVVEQRLAHDHHPVIASQMASIELQLVPDGIRLRRPVGGKQLIDAAMAARMAWWRAQSYEPSGPLMMSLG